MIKKTWPIIAFLLLLSLSAYIASFRISDEIRQEDIYYSFVEGERITHYENPYSRIHESDMLTNRKYATYFPLFYELSALSIWLGFARFPHWLQLWRIVFFIANSCVATIIFYKFYKRGWDLLGLLAASLWLFNGWTLYVVFVVHLDIFAVLPFVLAMVLYPKFRELSLIILGVSLAIKQIAIFALPLFLIWEYQNAKSKAASKAIGALILTALVPLLTAIPFLRLDASGFLKSTAFSVTRLPQQTLKAMDVSRYLGLEPLFARIPLILALSLIYLCVWRFKLPKFISMFLVFFAFTEFNPVNFAQYLVWPMAVLPFVIYEIYDLYASKGQKANGSRQRKRLAPASHSPGLRA